MNDEPLLEISKYGIDSKPISKDYAVRQYIKMYPQTENSFSNFVRKHRGSSRQNSVILVFRNKHLKD